MVPKMSQSWHRSFSATGLWCQSQQRCPRQVLCEGALLVPKDPDATWLCPQNTLRRSDIFGIFGMLSCSFLILEGLVFPCPPESPDLVPKNGTPLNKKDTRKHQKRSWSPKLKRQFNFLHRLFGCEFWDPGFLQISLCQLCQEIKAIHRNLSAPLTQASFLE